MLKKGILIALALWLQLISVSNVVYAQTYDEFYHNGRKAEGQGQFKKAQELYSKAISIDKSRYEAIYALAKIYSWNEKTRNKSVQMFDSLYSQLKSNVQFLKDYGSVLYWVKSYDKALKILNPLVKRYPNDIELLNMLSNIYLAMDDLDNALNCALKVLKIKPANTEALKNAANIFFWSKNYPQAVDYYKTLINKGLADKQIKENYVYALVYLKEFAKADEVLEDIRLDKLKYLKAKAKIKNYSGEKEEAAGYYATAYALDPNDIDIIKEYSGLLVALKKYDEARQLLEILGSMDPDSPDYLKSMAAIYSTEGNFAKNIEIYNKLLAQSDADADTIVQLAYAYLFNKQYAEALNVIETYKNAVSDDAYAAISAKANFYAGNNKVSEGFYEQAVALNPDDNDLKEEYADVLLGNNELDKSEQVLLTLDKTESNLLKLANVSLMKKNYNQVAKYLDEVLSLDPENPEALFMKAESEFYQGNLQVALEYYQKAYALPKGKQKKILKRLAELSSYTKDIKQATQMYDRLQSEYPEEKINAMLGEAEAHQISGSLYRARGQYEAVLDVDNTNLKAKLGIAHIHNDLNQMLHAIAILEPLLSEYPDNEEVKETLARSYSLLGRKDKAVQILGSAYLKNNKDDNYFLKEIYWNNRSNVTTTFNLRRESGDINNKLNFESYGGVVNLYPKGNLRVSTGFSASPYRSGEGIAKTTTLDYNMFGFEYQPTNRLNLKANFSLVDFTNRGSEFNTSSMLTVRASDNFIARLSYNRRKMEDSMLSLAGFIPAVGAYQNLLVGQATDNQIALSGTVLAPYLKLDFTGQYFAGFVTAEQIPTNFYQGFATNAGYTILARDTYSPVNVLRFSNSTYFVSFDQNRSGFGGADLLFNPLGSDFGSVYPVPATNTPGTGGYFSPGYSVSSVFGPSMHGYFKELRLRYAAGMFTGFQNVKHDSVGLVLSPQLFLRFNEFGHVGADVIYNFNRYGDYNQHNVAAYMIFKM